VPQHRQEKDEDKVGKINRRHDETTTKQQRKLRKINITIIIKLEESPSTNPPSRVHQFIRNITFSFCGCSVVGYQNNGGFFSSPIVPK